MLTLKIEKSVAPVCDIKDLSRAPHQQIKN